MLASKWPRRPAPARLTQEFSDRFCDLARRGIPASTICAFLKLPTSAFRDWLDKGEVCRTAGGMPEKWLPFATFLEDYHTAVGEFLIGQQDAYMEAEPKEYYKHMVVLERRDKRNWSKYDSPGSDQAQSAPDERFD